MARGEILNEGWQGLSNELDHWRDAGLVATFWWRDDDAVSATPALDHLFDLSRLYQAPLSLAVIPAAADDHLAATVTEAADTTGVAVLQHGFDHKNHAPASNKKAEFHEARAPDMQKRNIARGRALLAARFGQRFRPVFVPPWNRFPPSLIGLLGECGLTGVSTFKARPASHPAPGLMQVNTHVDPIDWRGSRGLADPAAILAQAIGHLRARRTGSADPHEPTGLLTHHLVHDDRIWRFVADFLATTTAHPATRWLSADEAFADSHP